jgi:hypothetical protein
VAPKRLAAEGASIASTIGGLNRLGRAAAIVAGLAVGASATIAWRGGTDERPARARQAPSVTRFSFSAGSLAPVLAAETPPSLRLVEEPTTPEAALRLFLRAMTEGNMGDAFAVLDEASRQRFPTLPAWTRAQADRWTPVEFQFGSTRAAFGTADRVEIEVTSTQRPALDPIRGFVPARSRSLWPVERREGVWRVGADPVSLVPVLPDANEAVGAVGGWVNRLRACDRAGAASSQVSQYLYGPRSFVEAPCQRSGSWTVGDVAGLDAAADPADLVAAFGPGVDGWARLVAVEGPGTRFYAVVAPMGEGWQVAGVAAGR